MLMSMYGKDYPSSRVTRPYYPGKQVLEAMSGRYLMRAGT